MERHGYPEETYYTFSYSPVPNDDGRIGGIFCANSDDTRRVIGERQLALLRDLAARTAEPRTVADVASRAARATGWTGARPRARRRPGSRPSRTARRLPRPRPAGR